VRQQAGKLAAMATILQIERNRVKLGADVRVIVGFDYAPRRAFKLRDAVAHAARARAAAATASNTSVLRAAVDEDMYRAMAIFAAYASKNPLWTIVFMPGDAENAIPAAAHVEPPGTSVGHAIDSDVSAYRLGAAITTKTLLWEFDPAKAQAINTDVIATHLVQSIRKMRTARKALLAKQVPRAPLVSDRLGQFAFRGVIAYVCGDYFKYVVKAGSGFGTRKRAAFGERVAVLAFNRVLATYERSGAAVPAVLPLPRLILATIDVVLEQLGADSVVLHHPIFGDLDAAGARRHVAPTLAAHMLTITAARDTGAAFDLSCLKPVFKLVVLSVPFSGTDISDWRDEEV
jgi:hypothetical protein